MALSPKVRHALFHALRFCFRLAPMRESTRDAWRQKFLDRYSSVRPNAARGQPVTAARSHRPYVSSDGRAIGYVPYRQEPLPSPLPATLVAFYLPQFHAIAENDAWWGEGFTEWRNVTRALPQFEGHAQPRLPGALGYYDLSHPEAMRAQAKLAQEYGIGAFCFYFYWFAGKTLLEAPLQQWLNDPSITLPFCLCWANENWTRRWDGRADDILIGQKHSPEDDLAFIAHVAPYLRDPRYLRVDGKPMLLVYRPGLLPDAKATAARWRLWCGDNGIGEIFIAYVQSFERPDPRDLGFDAAVEFPPNLATPTDITASQRLINQDYSGQALDWRELAADYSQRPMPEYRLFPGVNCGWDNEPRQPGKGRTYLHASPRRYRDWLQATITSRLASLPASNRLVFINAWNEWAEGAVLEPDARLGHGWLQATRDALHDVEVPPKTSAYHLCVVIHAWHLDVLDEMLATLRLREWDCRVIVTTTDDKSARVRALLVSHSVLAEIELGENRGRDVLPFLKVVERLVSEGGNQLILKLHTKISPHLPDGEQWRRQLLSALASSSQMKAIRTAFDCDSHLGMVGPAGHLLQLRDFMGANRDHVAFLATAVGISQSVVDDTMFVSGSMFWARLAALRPLLDAHFRSGDFEPERAQIDGTMAHAMERFIATAVMSAGFHLRDSSLIGERTIEAVPDYPYARSVR